MFYELCLLWCVVCVAFYVLYCFVVCGVLCVLVFCGVIRVWCVVLCVVRVAFYDLSVAFAVVCVVCAAYSVV